jgi:hypothetical protein
MKKSGTDPVALVSAAAAVPVLEPAAVTAGEDGFAGAVIAPESNAA